MDWGFEDIEVAAGEVVNDIGSAGEPERETEDMSDGTRIAD